MRYNEICSACGKPATFHNGRGVYICPCRNQKQWKAVEERDRKEGIAEDRLMAREF